MTISFQIKMPVYGAGKIFCAGYAKQGATLNFNPIIVVKGSFVIYHKLKILILQ